MINKTIYLLGILLRNNWIFQNYNFLLKSQHWNLNELQKYQLNKLKVLIEYAYENSKYYREKYKNENFHPIQLKSLDDLHRIPIITKEDLLNNTENVQIRNISEKLFFSETSGATGKPLVFYRNKDWDAWHRASIYRGYSWHNIKPWDKNGYLWGYNFSFKKRIKIRFLDCLQNRFRLFSYKDVEIEKFIKKLEKATYLGGYSSMIYEIAKKINMNNKKAKFDLKMVKGTSEKIFEKYQIDVKKAFGKKIISEYGAAEAGIIAFECPKGNMHVNMETAIVEEKNKEIIVTNLVSKSFPIIRYKIGDYIELDQNMSCECGIAHNVIKEVTGRVGKVIYGFKNQYPSLTLYYIFKNLAINNNLVINYKAIQQKKGYLEVQIESVLKKRENQLLNKEFLKYVGSDLKLNIVQGVNMKSKDKKKTDFISRL
jgi:phenylacetate-CoA ligase